MRSKIVAKTSKCSSLPEYHSVLLGQSSGRKQQPDLTAVRGDSRLNFRRKRISHMAVQPETRMCYSLPGNIINRRGLSFKMLSS